MHTSELAHSTTDLPPFSIQAIVTETQIWYWFTFVLLAVVVVYLVGVWKLYARGDRWSAARVASFLTGLALIAFATISGFGAYDELLFSVHMGQHMILAMVAPIFLALGAPVTLALRTLPKRPRQLLLSVLHSDAAKLLATPLVTFGLFVASPYALYFSELYQFTLENRLAHEWLHAHFLLVGCAFFWPLIGLDPLPGKWPYPARALLMFLSMPIHAVLGLTIMDSTDLLASEHYLSLHVEWIDPYMQQEIGGGLLWASGDVVSLLMLGSLVAQWVRASRRQAEREDRYLDRLEREQDAIASQREETSPHSPAVQ